MANKILYGNVDVSLVKDYEFTEERICDVKTNMIDNLFSVEDTKKLLDFIFPGTNYDELDLDFFRVKFYFRKEDLSYATFENIENLHHLNLQIDECKSNINLISVDSLLTCTYNTSDLSLKLKDLKYEIPANNISRGGKRKIFFNDSLAKSINELEIVNFLNRNITLINDELTYGDYETTIQEIFDQDNKSLEDVPIQNETKQNFRPLFLPFSSESLSNTNKKIIRLKKENIKVDKQKFLYQYSHDSNYQSNKEKFEMIPKYINKVNNEPLVSYQNLEIWNDSLKSTNDKRVIYHSNSYPSVPSQFPNFTNQRNQPTFPLFNQFHNFTNQPTFPLFNPSVPSPFHNFTNQNIFPLSNPPSVPSPPNFTNQALPSMMYQPSVPSPPNFINQALPYQNQSQNLPNYPFFVPENSAPTLGKNNSPSTKQKVKSTDPLEEYKLNSKILYKEDDVFKFDIISKRPPRKFNKGKKKSNIDSNFDTIRFVGCNNVFRINEFQPGDPSFKFHFDTPFVDRMNKHLSLYTIIIYLTSGYNPNGVLRIFTEDGEYIINSVEAGDVIIFDQQYPHIGNPFVNGVKRFIRSELIYEVNNLKYNEKVAEIFNSACYYQIKANRYSDKDMQKYSSDLFNDVMSVRNGNNSSIKMKYTICKNNDHYYITNGSKYYFYLPKLVLQNDSEDLEDVVLLIVSDYLNINNKDNQIIVKRKNIELNMSPFEMLNNLTFDDNFSDVSKNLKSDFPSDYEIFCNCPMCVNDRTTSSIFRELPELGEFIARCVPKSYSCFSAKNGKNQNIFVNFKYSFEEYNGFNKGIITFQTNQKNVNFASCQGISLYDYKISLKDQQANVYDFPPIHFVQNGAEFTFSIDMFDNGFVYSRPIVNPELEVIDSY